ncbi:MAG TPA: alpha-L-fucosidase [Verrucomicrobiota bacterium]|nr:alpha-L-fucosidase [Verrucomicrobiota bacterium]HNU49683.1 alpha-L-fucosidase [Verrucomicrobiota bacterium]
MKPSSSAILVAVLAVAACLHTAALPAASPESPAERDARLAWWRDARFGLFIHWGPVSLKGTEIGWSRGGDRRGYGSRGSEVPADVYDNLFKQFNPTGFNAREWVALAQAAGMKYLVFTSRHHDGFSMFDTAVSDHKITNPSSPFRRDVVKELADACHEAGLRFGLYYSQPDWHHPDAFTPDRHNRYLDYLRAQVRELCSNYGRLDIFWFDGLGKSAADYDGQGLVHIIRSLQPAILVNNRTGLPEDFDTPEQQVGKFQIDRPWESCITICHQWAWKPNDRLKSLEECLHTLVRCAGGDGNLLFNVGPMPDGRIEPRQVDRLREMGAWLARHGSSIYGTRGGPFKPGAWGASTRRGNTVFLHLFQPSDRPLDFPPLKHRVKAATLLHHGTAVGVQQTPERLTLDLPPASWQTIDTVVTLDLDGPASELPPVSLASASLAAGKPARASNVHQGQREYAASRAMDDDDTTRWATDGGTHAAWIEVDLGKPTAVGRLKVDEAFSGRVRRFELQYLEGETWKACLTGTTLGNAYNKSFPPVTARVFRLNILEATEGPTLNELQLFPPGR